MISILNYISLGEKNDYEMCVGKRWIIKLFSFSEKPFQDKVNLLCSIKDKNEEIDRGYLMNV